MSKPGILVVEDEWLIAEHHRTVLVDAGFHVVGPTPSVRHAMQLIETEAVACALLDIGLNGQTSVALIPRLLERSIPFLFASGYSPTDVPEELKTYSILAKPVPASVLVAAVRDSLVSATKHRN